jgi:hypothetical protein
MKSLFFQSQLLNNGPNRFPACHKVFQQYKTNSGRYVRYIKHFRQSFTDRFVGFDRKRALLKTFSNLFKAPQSNAAATISLTFISLFLRTNINKSIQRDRLPSQPFDLPQPQMLGIYSTDWTVTDGTHHFISVSRQVHSLFQTECFWRETVQEK